MADQEPENTNIPEANNLAPEPIETPSSGGGFSPPRILFGFFIAGFVLLFLFYFVLLWSLVNGNVSNPLFEVLGMKPDKLKDTILILTNALFGLTAFILLLVSLVKVFQWFIVGKNAVNRRDYAIKSLLFGTVFIATALIWFWLVWLIEKTQVVVETTQLNDSVIMTTPVSLNALTAPVTVEFDVGTKLAEQRITKDMIQQINWDLNGDGAIDASGPKISYKYVNKGDAEGRFGVTVKVDYTIPGVGPRTFQANREVFIANEAALAVITATPEGGALPLKVKLSAANSADPDGEIMLYEWDLDGDGEYEIRGDSELLQERTFTLQGDFPIRLRVTGRNSDVGLAEKIIKVTLPDGNLRAEINALEGMEGVAPFKVTFDGQQSFVQLGTIVKYEWFIEGEPKSVVGRTIQRTFYDPGEYQVSLVVENDLGEKHKMTEVVKVLDRRVAVNVNVKTDPLPNPNGILEGVVPFTIAFDSSSSQITDPVEWRWDFENDGEVDAYDPAVRYTFREVGTYQVKLVIVDAFGDAHEHSGIVLVKPAGVVANLEATPIAGEAPLKVSFDASSSTSDQGEIVTYVWELPGQAPIHYGAKLDYEFKTVGQYTTKLTVVTDRGIQHSDTVTVSVRSKPIKANFSSYPAAGAAPLEVGFDPTGSTGTILKYEWSFGDGQTSKEVAPVHTYTEAGTYTVKLRIEDAKGILSEAEHTVQVTE